jgi:hypothetical protein
MRVESGIRESAEDLSDKTVRNFHKILRIVKGHGDAGKERRPVLNEITNHHYEHFVPLLSMKHLHLDGVYLLRADLARLEKLWGSGPLTISPAAVDSFCYQNMMTKEFIGTQWRAFQTDLDAVCLWNSLLLDNQTGSPSPRLANRVC